MKKVDIKSIELIVYDFDGVLTDNRVLVFEDGREAVYCNRSDGLAIKRFKGLDIPQVILSAEQNPIVKARAKKLGIPAIHNLKDKRQALLQYCTEHNCNPENVLYVGNDVNDLEAMKAVGYPVAPSDAAEAVKKVAKILTQAKGGQGVVSELFDMVT